MGLFRKLRDGRTDAKATSERRSPEKEQVLTTYKSYLQRNKRRSSTRYRGKDWKSEDPRGLAPQVWDEIVKYFCSCVEKGAEQATLRVRFNSAYSAYSSRKDRASLSFIDYVREGRLDFRAPRKLEKSCSPDWWSNEIAKRANAAGFAVECSKDRDDSILVVELLSAAEREEIELEVEAERAAAEAARKKAREEQQRAKQAALEAALAELESGPESAIEHKVEDSLWRKITLAIADDPKQPTVALSWAIHASQFCALASIPYPATTAQFERGVALLFGDEFDPSSAHAADRALWELAGWYRKSRAYAGSLADKLPGKWFDLVDKVAGLEITPTPDELQAMIANAGLDTFNSYAKLMGYASSAEVPNKEDWDEHLESRFGASSKQDLGKAALYVANTVAGPLTRFTQAIAKEEAERKRREAAERAAREEERKRREEEERAAREEEERKRREEQEAAERAAREEVRELRQELEAAERAAREELQKLRQELEETRRALEQQEQAKLREQEHASAPTADKTALEADSGKSDESQPRNAGTEQPRESADASVAEPKTPIEANTATPPSEPPDPSKEAEPRHDAVNPQSTTKRDTLPDVDNAYEADALIDVGGMDNIGTLPDSNDVRDVDDMNGADGAGDAKPVLRDVSRRTSSGNSKSQLRPVRSIPRGRLSGGAHGKASGSK